MFLCVSKELKSAGYASMIGVADKVYIQDSEDCSIEVYSSSDVKTFFDMKFNISNLNAPSTGRRMSPPWFHVALQNNLLGGKILAIRHGVFYNDKPLLFAEFNESERTTTLLLQDNKIGMVKYNNMPYDCKLDIYWVERLGRNFRFCISVRSSVPGEDVDEFVVLLIMNEYGTAFIEKIMTMPKMQDSGNWKDWLRSLQQEPFEFHIDKRAYVDKPLYARVLAASVMGVY